MQTSLTQQQKQQLSSQNGSILANAQAQWGGGYLSFLKDYPTHHRASKVSSLSDACSRNYVSLHSIEKTYGKGSAIFWLKYQLIEVFTFLGLFEKVTPHQINSIAEKILAHNGYLTPAELMVFFERFECGEYALFKNTYTVNPQMLLVSLPHFVADVQQARKKAEDERREQEEEREKKRVAAIPYEEYKDNRERLATKVSSVLSSLPTLNASTPLTPSQS